MVKLQRPCCLIQGCTRGARGTTDYCIKHGGGKRCKKDGCTRSARGSTDYCSKHGGGKRCKEDGCIKGAQGSTDYCKNHGGGKRCKEDGCIRSAQDPTDYCKKHGGGKRCKEDGCTRSARGSTDYCSKHGGGKRCESPSCVVYPVRERGYGRYRAPRPCQIYRSFIAEDTVLCYNCLAAIYPDCVTLKVRREHLVLAEIQRRIPELADSLVTWDCPVPGGCSLLRPDMLWNLDVIYLHVEVDEGGEKHENSQCRIWQIQQDVEKALGLQRGVVIRVNADGILTKRQHSDGEVKWTSTRIFEDRMAEVATYIETKVLPRLTDPLELAVGMDGPSVDVVRIGF